jgi:hypothetical protein
LRGHAAALCTLILLAACSGAAQPSGAPLTAPSQNREKSAASQPSTSVGTDGQVAPILGDIPVGACFNERLRSDQRIDGGVMVPCYGPHQLEMYAHVTLSDPLDKPYPGDDAMNAAGESACRPLFKSYVGIDYDRSEYTFWYYTPDETTWLFLRRVDCAIGNSDRTTLSGGSAKNTRR